MGWMVQGNWEKPPSDFDTTAWMLEHTALVNKERESLEGTGYVVHTENQNLFRLRGTTATIAGKPDPIGEKTNEILISDAKTGHRSPSHRAQVQIYQYAVPKALTQFQGKQARGQVRYPDSYVGSPATSVTPDFVANLGSLIRRLADDVPARRVPSAQECRYCDITRADCPGQDGRLRKDPRTTSSPGRESHAKSEQHRRTCRPDNGRSYCRRRTYISRWGKPHVTTAPSTVPKTSEDTFSSTANHLSRRCCFLSVRISSARPR